MAWANKYRFRFESIHGVEYNIYILKDGYSGSVIQRALGRAPVLRKKKNGPICGTSLELYAECLVNGEFAELYTSDPKEYKVEVYRDSVKIWTGFVSTELYSEPGIAPPYDVQIVATDGLGELKLNNYEAQGEVSLSVLFGYILSFTGSARPIRFAWDIREYQGTVQELLDGGLIDLDYRAGDTLYDVLTYILESFHAVITAFDDSWLILRETDISASASSLTTYDVPASGGSAVQGSISNINESLGKMGVADLWPVGQYSSKIEPARKSVSIYSPWHIDNILADPNMSHSQGGWSSSTHTSWLNGTVIIGTDYGIGYVYQSISLQSLKNSLDISAVARRQNRPHGSALYFYVKYQTANATYWGDADGWSETQPTSPRVRHDMNGGDYEQVSDTIPNPEYTDAGTLTVYLYGTNVQVKSAYLTLSLPSKGYKDVLSINNGARGEGDDVEVFHGRILSDEITYTGLLSGALKKTVSGVKSSIYKFTDAHNSNKDFLALTALSYAMSVALRRARREGIFDVPSWLVRVPIYLTIESVRHAIETYDWDMKNEEVNFSALSLPAASITVESESVTPLDGSESAGGSSSGGGSGSGGGSSSGASLLSVWRSLANNPSLVDFGDETPIAAEHLSSLFSIETYTETVDGQTVTREYLKINTGFTGLATRIYPKAGDPSVYIEFHDGALHFHGNIDFIFHGDIIATGQVTAAYGS